MKLKVVLQIFCRMCQSGLQNREVSLSKVAVRKLCNTTQPNVSGLRCDWGSVRPALWLHGDSPFELTRKEPGPSEILGIETIWRRSESLKIQTARFSIAGPLTAGGTVRWALQRVGAGATFSQQRGHSATPGACGLCRASVSLEARILHYLRRRSQPPVWQSQSPSKPRP